MLSSRMTETKNDNDPSLRPYPVPPVLSLGLDKIVFNDATKKLGCIMMHFVRVLREELVLLEQVLDHAVELALLSLNSRSLEFLEQQKFSGHRASHFWENAGQVARYDMFYGVGGDGWWSYIGSGSWWSWVWCEEDREWGLGAFYGGGVPVHAVW